jgi:phosphate transport system substrate-binding protein
MEAMKLVLAAAGLVCLISTAVAVSMWPGPRPSQPPPSQTLEGNQEVKPTTAAVALAALITSSPALAQAVKVDAKIPEYKTVQGISGSIKSVGSDTMNNLMTLWGEGFKTKYPNVTTEVEGKGSSTAPAALISGSADLGPMSRAMKDKEIDDFQKAFGYKPTEIATSIDMLAIYVHKDNPIKGLTMGQVDAIFSKTRKSGAERDIVTWGDLGLTGEWQNKPISLYGRNSASGTYGYFKEHALAKGDFKDTVKEQPGSSSVVQGVASDRYAIGYSGIGYKTADVLAVPLAKNAESGFVEATPENAYTGKFPMARFLYVYVNQKPNSDLDPLRREFLKYVLSRQGQEDVVKDGYYPLTARLVAENLKKIGVDLPAATDAAAPR